MDLLGFTVDCQEIFDKTGTGTGSAMLNTDDCKDGVCEIEYLKCFECNKNIDYKNFTHGYKLICEDCFNKGCDATFGVDKDTKCLKLSNKPCCSNCIRFERIKGENHGYCQEWEVLHVESDYCERWENDECDYANGIEGMFCILCNNKIEASSKKFYIGKSLVCEHCFADECKFKNDDVNHPKHYTQGKIETIDYIEHMGYIEGNIIKYVSRYKYKNGLEDLKKARWYLDRLINNESEGKNE